jgi:hypothetical protein
MKAMDRKDSAVRAATVWALVLAALTVIAPFSVRGIACGHDLTFHMDSWMEVAQQWREGVVYPRWAAYANYGSGEPRFLFYPPLSWMLGGALGTVIPWLFVPVALDFCAVFLAGLAMHLLAREWLNEPDATLVAVAYAVNPYMLLTIYARSAFAEMLAASLLPLIILWVIRDRPAWEMFVPLSLTMAAAWLTNVPAAIMFSYTVVLLLAVITIFRRNSRIFFYGGSALLLGVALAAFYIVPVLYEKNWITWGQLLSAGVRPNENFLFARTGEAQHDRFLTRLSWLAAAELAVTALAILAARSRRSTLPKLWWSLVILAGISFFLMLPVMGFAYRLMPELRFVQFPWRWLLITGAAYAVFVVIALPGFRRKSWVYALLFAVLIVAANLAGQPRCDPADTPFMISNVYHTGYGYMGTDEYVPAGGDNYEIKPDFPEFRLREEDGGSVPSDAHGTVLYWKTYNKQVAVDSSQSVQAVLRLMNYPAWRVTVNGIRISPQSDDPTGRMLIALPAGHSQVEVQFVRTPDRWLGDGISVATFIFLCGIWYVGRRRSQ